jgi:hypothetical protein
MPASPPPPVLLRATFFAGFLRIQNANNGGHSRQNLRTAVTRSEPESLSLGRLLSKAPDFADLVQLS